MKPLLILLLSLFTLPANDNGLFTEDVIVKNGDGKEINLKNIEITKDTVMVFTWSYWCGSCKKYLDSYKANKRYKNYQIIAVAIVKGDSIKLEKQIADQHQWPFEVYYDNKQNVAKFLYKKGYYKFDFKYEKKVGFYGFPNIFMFVKGKFLCTSCDKYANPHSQK
jgi:peroxiredoxin